jgi:hypothetical protein
MPRVRAHRRVALAAAHGISELQVWRVSALHMRYVLLGKGIAPMARYRSYDFYAGDTLYLEGERVGYTRCTLLPGRLDGPYPPEVVDDLTALDGEHCIHIAIRVDAESPAWAERGGSRKVGQIVYPPLIEDGKVVPLDPPSEPEPGTEHDWSDAADRVRAWLA